MSSRSGEKSRRAALGIGSGRNGAQVAQALQTIRYSALESRKASAPVKRDVLLTTRRDKGHLIWALTHEAARIKGERAEIVERLTALGPHAEVGVSDHAVIRFLERAMDIDINAVRAQIARLIPVEKLEADRVLYLRNGLQFLLSENNIITVLDGHMDPEICSAFAIDDAGIAPLRPVNAAESAASVAARTLSRIGHGKTRAKIDAMNARLRAELERAQ